MTQRRWRRQVERRTRNSMRSRRVQPKSDPRRHPRRRSNGQASVGGCVYWVRFKSVSANDGSIVRSSSSSSFLRPPDRLFAVRYLRTRIRMQDVERKRIALFAGGSRSRIPRARITRRGCLLSILSLDERRSSYAPALARRWLRRGTELRDKNCTIEFIDHAECRIR